VQQIPHYSDYLAADDGTIYSTKRTPNTVCKVTSETADSPPRVQIRRDGSSGNHYVPVAVLVASAYLGDQPEELSVMHLDGDLRIILFLIRKVDKSTGEGSGGDNVNF
jgi:hypothetical protein